MVNIENSVEKVFKEEELTELLKSIGLIKSRQYRKHVQKLRLKNIDDSRNYFVEIIEQNELMSKKHKKVCTTLNYIEDFLF